MQTVMSDLKGKGGLWADPFDEAVAASSESTDEPAELLVCRLGAAVGHVVQLVLEQEGHLPSADACRAAEIQAGIVDVCRIATTLGQIYDTSRPAVGRQVPLWRLAPGDAPVGSASTPLRPIPVEHETDDMDGWDGYVDEDRARNIARLLGSIADSGSGMMPQKGLVPCLHEHIDLSTAQGRWELLALAVLYGAPVKEDVAERAFLGLRSAGLLDLHVLAPAGEGTMQAVLRCLKETYFARTSKEQKAQALRSNGQLLLQRWGGDLMQLYCEAEADGDLVISHLTEFHHVRKRAPWIALMMCRGGLWSLPTGHICFVESGVRTALAKLTITRKRPVREGELTDKECDYVIQRYFQGDASGLAYLGRTSCKRESLADCTPCRLRPLCGVWR